MQSYEYVTPDAKRGDKRKWVKGTPVTVTLLGGSTLKTETSSAPVFFGAGGWAVRVVGVPYVVALERVTRRYQITLPLEESGRVARNDKQT